MLEGFNKEVSTFAADVDRAFWITTGISLSSRPFARRFSLRSMNESALCWVSDSCESAMKA